MKEKFYSRKISSKESEKGFIFILKNQLNYFPDLNDHFILTNGELSKTVSIKSYPCTCRGPDKPHEHYYIPWNGLSSGEKIEITKTDVSHNYFLTVYK